jgi:hypothetical protein
VTEGVWPTYGSDHEEQQTWDSLIAFQTDCCRLLKAQSHMNEVRRSGRRRNGWRLTGRRGRSRGDVHKRCRSARVCAESHPVSLLGWMEGIQRWTATVVWRIFFRGNTLPPVTSTGYRSYLWQCIECRRIARLSACHCAVLHLQLATANSVDSVRRLREAESSRCLVLDLRSFPALATASHVQARHGQA